MSVQALSAQETSRNRPFSILQVLEKGRFQTGSVVQMYELARGLTRRGHRLAIVSRPEGEVPARCREEGLDFLPLGLRHEFDLASARRLAKIFEGRSVDLVHVHKGIAHSVALFATFLSRRRPAIVVNRGVSFPLDPFNRIKYRVRLDAVVAVCGAVKDVLVSSGKVPPQKVHVIHAGVDLSRFDAARVEGASVRREWGITDSELLLVQVGAREWKGWRDLLEASHLLAGRFPDLVTAVVACKDEAEKERIAAVAREKGIARKVRAIGFRSDMPEVLAAADIVADMSYAGLGITGTIREAMALGKPVVASAAGGNPELVEDGVCGLLVPPRDPKALSAALARFLSEADLRARLGARARERVAARFSTERRLDRIETLYRSLIAARTREEARGEPTRTGM